MRFEAQRKLGKESQAGTFMRLQWSKTFRPKGSLSIHILLSLYLCDFREIILLFGAVVLFCFAFFHM